LTEREILISRFGHEVVGMEDGDGVGEERKGKV